MSEVKILKAYCVLPQNGTDDNGKPNQFWQRIGTCYPHADGRGFNLALNALPIGNRIVIREGEISNNKELEDGEGI